LLPLFQSITLFFTPFILSETWCSLFFCLPFGAFLPATVKIVKTKYKVKVQAFPLFVSWGDFFCFPLFPLFSSFYFFCPFRRKRTQEKKSSKFKILQLITKIAKNHKDYVLVNWPTSTRKTTMHLGFNFKNNKLQKLQKLQKITSLTARNKKVGVRITFFQAKNSLFFDQLIGCESLCPLKSRP
jgi:hypothetical protein